MNSQPGNPGVRSPFRTAAAMTLIEMMVTMSVFSLAMLAFLAIHIFGLKQDELIQSKLGASDQSRKSFDLITRDIRSAKIWRLGTVSGTTFTALTNGALQQAPGLQLSFTNNYTTNIMYYFTTVNGDNQLFRRRTGGTATVVASNLINTLTFSAQDYAGTIKSDLQWRYVIHFILQFRQFQYPLTQVGSNYLYDFYKLEFRATPHAPD
ncbi:MAG: prepilin-type N-terminal cleavage/methylation domain-containing protein [Verrucomicrobiota bacterium]